MDCPDANGTKCPGFPIHGRDGYRLPQFHKNCHQVCSCFSLHNNECAAPLAKAMSGYAEQKPWGVGL